MKTQTIINCVFAVAFVGYVVSQLNPTFDSITCKEWRVVDNDGKLRIKAGTFADGTACVIWLDTDGNARIAAGTGDEGSASVVWLDKDEKRRIAAGVRGDGYMELPTEDLNPPKEP